MLSAHFVYSIIFFDDLNPVFKAGPCAATAPPEEGVHMAAWNVYPTDQAAEAHGVTLWIPASQLNNLPQPGRPCEYIGTVRRCDQDDAECDGPTMEQSFDPTPPTTPPFIVEVHLIREYTERIEADRSFIAKTEARTKALQEQTRCISTRAPQRAIPGNAPGSQRNDASETKISWIDICRSNSRKHPAQFKQTSHFARFFAARVVRVEQSEARDSKSRPQTRFTLIPLDEEADAMAERREPIRCNLTIWGTVSPSTSSTFNWSNIKTATKVVFCNVRVEEEPAMQPGITKVQIRVLTSDAHSYAFTFPAIDEQPRSQDEARKVLLAQAPQWMQDALPASRWHAGAHRKKLPTEDAHGHDAATQPLTTGNQSTEEESDAQATAAYREFFSRHLALRNEREKQRAASSAAVTQ